MIFTASQQFTTLGLLTIVPAGHGAVCSPLRIQSFMLIRILPRPITAVIKADIVFYTIMPTIMIKSPRTHSYVPYLVCGA